MQPLACSHCCWLLPHSPVPLVALLNHWLVPQWPLPQATNCQWATVSGPAQSLVSTTAGPSHKQLSVSNCWWPLQSTVGKVVVLRLRLRLETDPGFSQGSPCLGPVDEQGGPGRRLKAVFRRAPEPSPRPPTGQAQVLRWHPPSPPLSPHGSHRLNRTQSAELAPASGQP